MNLGPHDIVVNLSDFLNEPFVPHKSTLYSSIKRAKNCLLVYVLAKVDPDGGVVLYLKIEMTTIIGRALKPF